MHKKCKSEHHTKLVNIKSGESNLLTVTTKQNTMAPRGVQSSDIKEKYNKIWRKMWLKKHKD